MPSGLAVVALVAADHGRAAGFLVAAGALATGTLVAAYLAGSGRAAPPSGRRAEPVQPRWHPYP